MRLSTNASSSRYPRAERPADAEHITIYRDPEYYAGFPFNHNFWTFPDGDLLINFARARCSYGQSHDLMHGVVDGMHGEYVTLRSTDGGETWPIDSLQVLGTHQSLERQVVSGLAPEAPAEPLDWTSPDFCVTAGSGAHRSLRSTSDTCSTRATEDVAGRALTGCLRWGSRRCTSSPTTWSGPTGWSCYS